MVKNAVATLRQCEIVINVVALALGEAVDEYASVARAEGNKSAVSTAASLALAWHPLLDKATPEIGVDKGRARHALRHRKASHR
jgi:hypothetical protein